ncbi:MAG: RecX family transcriptional regulator [Gaiellaceae bacterium]
MRPEPPSDYSGRSSRITALRRARPGWVAVELGGEPWRTVPDAVVVRCGLRTGLELERPLAREVGRELRRAQALGDATRALRARPLSEQRLRERLRARGVAREAERSALATLSDAGFVDDARLAEGRAAALAERGWGDAAIAARLAGEGIPAELAGAAVSSLAPERDRAARVATSTSDPRKAWALLARRGFDAETIDAVLGPLDEGAP